MSDEKKELTPGIGVEAKAIHEAFDKTKVTFHDRAATLAAFKEGREIISEDGQLFTRYDNEFLPLSDALLRYAYDNRAACDGRTLPRTGTAGGRPGVTSKADLKTLKDKVAYVNEFGEASFLALPLTGQATSEILTQADFRKLPLAEKVRLTNTDPDYVAKLKSSPGVRMPGQPFIDQAKLDRIAAIRPASRKR